MKYYIHWLIMGLFVFWLLEITAYVMNVTQHPNAVLEFSIPLAFWGVGSLLEFQQDNNKKRIINEYKARTRRKTSSRRIKR